ncbi:MAG: phosphoglycolate phosphatase [Acidovorax sp.]|nr:phosphoglycolate phosphatase [Acidovorax sp.]
MPATWSGVRAVLFDLDGTLLDSAPDLAAAANVVRRNAGLEDLPLADYRPFVGTGARGMLRIALGLQPDMPEFEARREEFFQAYEGLLMQHSGLFSGVPQLVQSLEQQGRPWGIVTNKSERFTLPIARQEATLGRAAVVVCGDTTAHAKPHPAPLLYACERLGIAPEQAIYVGDDERDMQAARAAGMRAVAADYGYLGGVESTDAWNPDAAIKNPLELLNLLGVD